MMQKNSLVSGDWPGEKFFVPYPPDSRMCIRIYIFCFKKKHTQTEKQNKLNNKQNKRKANTNRKAKQTKE